MKKKILNYLVAKARIYKADKYTIHKCNRHYESFIINKRHNILIKLTKKTIRMPSNCVPIRICKLCNYCPEFKTFIYYDDVNSKMFKFSPCYSINRTKYMYSTIELYNKFSKMDMAFVNAMDMLYPKTIKKYTGAIYVK